jgi:DNA invertase Pin-like site-specific DNA recombinase
MKIGYARVSTADQNLDLQLSALKEAGCDLVFDDRASGAVRDRRGLKKALARCGNGDVLVVWKLDRLGRSLIDLVGIVRKLEDKGAGLKVLTGQGAAIDTTKAEGRLIFGIFASLAEFERELIRERTVAGMRAARARGVRIGRPPKLTAIQVERAARAIASGETGWREEASKLGVDVTTLRRAVRQHSGGGEKPPTSPMAEARGRA